MKKLKIYLDSCTINNLDEPSEPVKMAEMQAVWELIKEGEYDLVISNVVLNEIIATKDEKRRTLLLSFLSEVTYEFIRTNEEIEHIAEIIANSGMLVAEKHRNDRLHIGCALVARADMLVSNNFDHMVTAKTIMGVRKIAIVEGYGFMEIFSPNMILNDRGGI